MTNGQRRLLFWRKMKNQTFTEKILFPTTLKASLDIAKGASVVDLGFLIPGLTQNTVKKIG